MGNMKSKLGITLRKIRKGKQISLCSIADSNLSKSQISRFERGESEISCIRLINILDKLHITLDEFIILHDNNLLKLDHSLTWCNIFENTTPQKILIVLLNYYQTLQVITWVLMKRQW